MTGSLRLDSTDLFSKWGFGDGDEPDDLLDLLDEDPAFDYATLDWHELLAGYVETVLVPALPYDVITYRIETIHNPIRAESVDGVPVPADAERSHPFVTALPHVVVHVPLHQVADDVRAHLAGRRP